MSSESAEAQAKYECPACGGEAEWSPEKKALLCAYCGTEAPGDLDESTGQIREIDLVSALRNLGEESRGWKSDRVAVKCQSCDAITVFDPKTTAQECEFCGSSQILPY